MSTSATSPRLTQHDREGIRDAVVRACVETNATWQSIVLFGSRVDPRRFGGDIDLLVTLDPSQPVDVYRFTQRLGGELTVGERESCEALTSRFARLNDFLVVRSSPAGGSQATDPIGRAAACQPEDPLVDVTILGLEWKP